MIGEFHLPFVVQDHVPLTSLVIFTESNDVSPTGQNQEKHKGIWEIDSLWVEEPGLQYGSWRLLTVLKPSLDAKRDLIRSRVTNPVHLDLCHLGRILGSLSVESPPPRLFSQECVKTQSVLP